jgi:hypothetical protein
MFFQKYKCNLFNLDLGYGFKFIMLVKFNLFNFSFDLGLFPNGKKLHYFL